MSLYDGVGVDTGLTSDTTKPGDTQAQGTSLSGWSSGLKLMASQIQRNKKASKASQQRAKVQPSTAILETTGTLHLSGPSELTEDDLAVELVDEYDPLMPNNYELVLKDRKEQEEKARDEERKRHQKRRELTRTERRRRNSSGSDSDGESDDESAKRSKRKDSAAIPPPVSLQQVADIDPSSQSEEQNVVESALAELSRTKAQKANPFSAPKFGSVASSIMSKYGWREGQGLGKQSQGISTALSVQKTSKRGGKIVNASAEREQFIEQEKKKAQTIADMMKSPTKVVLLQNMVGPGEVDDDLQPEVAEECSKYGEVVKCLVFEILEGAPDDEAVRIFIKFSRVEAAIKAVIDLNGRFFGGRTVKAGFFSEDRFARNDLAPHAD